MAKPAESATSSPSVKSTKKTCTEMLMEVHDPSVPTPSKSPEAQQLIRAKNELDRQLGLSELANTSLSKFAVEPYGGSNIICTGIHEKMVDGKLSGQFCITVYVHHKPTDPEEMVLGMVPKEVLGIPTDVVEVPEAQLQVVDTGGAVTGADGWQGTVAAVVKLSSFGNIGFLLSNQHVMNHSGSSSNLRRPVFGPGGDIVGKLQFWTSTSHTVVDGAVAVTKSTAIQTDYLGAFSLSPAWMTSAEIRSAIASSPAGGILVKKVGADSSPPETMGVCTTIPAVGAPGKTMVNQLQIQSTSGGPFSVGGDSGSLVVTHPDNRPIGLLWGGAGIFSYANEIENVVSVFGISSFVTAPNQISP